MSHEPPITRFDLSIRDVVSLTGIKYHVIYRALHAGEIVGIVRGRLIRTNRESVSVWLESLGNKPVSKPPKAPITAGHCRGGFKHLNPAKFGG